MQTNHRKNQIVNHYVFKSKEGQKQIQDHYNQIIAPWPFIKHHVPTSFGNTFVLEAGDPQNPPIVMLHGSCSNSAAWLADMPALVGDYHLFAIDWLGEPGNSEAVRLNYEDDAYLQWLDEVLSGLSITSAAIMGNSMGGWLALQYAAAHPQKTNALILLAPSGIVAPANDFIDRTAALSSSDDSGIQETSNGELPNSTCQNAAESSELLDAVMDSASLPPEVLAFMTLIMTHFIPMTGALPILSDAQMKNLSMPVLCLLADGDVTMNPAAAAKRLTSLVPHAIVTPIEGAHVITSAAAFALPFLKESR